MNKKQCKNKNLFIRMDKETLNKLSKLKLPNINQRNRRDSYADVLKRLLIKHHREMEKEKEEAYR